MRFVPARLSQIDWLLIALRWLLLLSVLGIMLLNPPPDAQPTAVWSQNAQVLLLIAAAVWQLIGGYLIYKIVSIKV